MAEVQETTVSQVNRPQIPSPPDEEQLFDQLMKFTEVSEAPDVDVEGDWTVRTAAAWKAGLQWADGVDRQGFTQLAENYAGPQLASSGNPSGLEASFGSGDTSMTVGVNSDYRMSNGWGASSTTLYSGSEAVATASAGEKVVSFGVPNAKVATLIGQFNFGIQFQAIAAIIESLPSLGASQAWSIPAFATANGKKSLSAYYTFSSAIPRTLTTVQADVKYNDTEAHTLDVILRDSNGKQQAKSQVQLSGSKSYSVSTTFAGLLSSGIVEFHTPGTAMAVSNTAVQPPRLM